MSKNNKDLPITYLLLTSCELFLISLMFLSSQRCLFEFRISLFEIWIEMFVYDSMVKFDSSVLPVEWVSYIRLVGGRKLANLNLFSLGLSCYHCRIDCDYNEFKCIWYYIFNVFCNFNRLPNNRRFSIRLYILFVWISGNT